MKKEIKKVEGKKIVWTEADFNLVSSDIPIEKLSKEIKERIKRIAELNNLPPTGITILGGRVYVNRTGLDTRLKELEKQGKIVKRIQSYPLQRPEKKNNYLCGYKCIIEFEDNPEREKLRAEIVKKAIEQNKSPEEIEKIIEMSGLTPPMYVAEGWCSPRTSPAISYEYKYSQEAQKKVPVGEPLVENTMMMAETKAQNRAIRLATGTGITSLEEVMYQEKVVDIEPEKIKKPEINIFEKETK